MESLNKIFCKANRKSCLFAFKPVIRTTDCISERLHSASALRIL